MSRRDYNHENGICSPAAYESIIEELEGQIEELKGKLKKAVDYIVEITEEWTAEYGKDLSEEKIKELRQEYE